jgi:ectoine hydroxylase-related dioxygenase (phytanoyl-CoA dioxygenase family)
VPPSLEKDGYTICTGVADAHVVQELLDATAAVSPGAAVRAKDARVHAVRNLMSAVPAVRRFAESPAARAAVMPILGTGAKVVRAILFDKTPGANWKVAWHQDLSIAVRERADVPGFGPWSVKSGVTHVQPPPQLLARMLTLRLHLDDCGPANGPLRVLPGSHTDGALPPAEVAAWRERVRPEACLVPAGGAVLMRPLILHASSVATALGHRRVVHLEWSADDLPGGLRWYEDG